MASKPGDDRPPAGGRGYVLWSAFALILVGLVLLLRNFTSFSLDRWWALFILAPAGASLAYAWRLRRHSGLWTLPARRRLLTGLWLAMIALIFLLNLEWGKVWPVFFIFSGLWLLSNTALFKE